MNGQQQCIEGEESVACVWRKRVGGGRDEERDDSSAEVWGRGAFPAPAKETVRFRRRRNWLARPRANLREARKVPIHEGWEGHLIMLDCDIPGNDHWSFFWFLLDPKTPVE